MHHNGEHVNCCAAISFLHFGLSPAVCRLLLSFGLTAQLEAPYFNILGKLLILNKAVDWLNA
jgi:hypothetical protein